MDKNVYLSQLDELSNYFETVPNTPMGMYLKALNLATLNMRYEKIAFNRNLSDHPYRLVKQIIQEQLAAFKTFSDVLFIEANEVNKSPENDPTELEAKHQTLFNIIWDKYDEVAFEAYIDRYKHRLQINHLVNLIKGKNCLDFGCGNGNFCFALADLGAEFVAGIDFGRDSINYANQVRENRSNGDKSENSAEIFEWPKIR